MSKLPFIACIALSLAVVEWLWWSGGTENIVVPIFWNTVFLGCLLFFGKDLVAVLRLYRHPETSPEGLALERFGPLADVVNRVESDLKNPRALSAGEATVTDDWLVISGKKQFAVRRLDDVVWAYPKKTTTRLNFLIPIWRGHSVVFCSDALPEVEARCPEKGAAEIIARVAERRPWIIRGFDEQCSHLWQSDRAAVVAYVQERKKL